MELEPRIVVRPGILRRIAGAVRNSPDDRDWIDLGSGHSYRLMYAVADGWADPWPARLAAAPEAFPDDLLWKADAQGQKLVLVGMLERHTGADSEACEGYVSFALPLAPSPSEQERGVWEVASLSPLDISPSLDCTREGCATHNCIHGGIWTDC